MAWIVGPVSAVPEPDVCYAWPNRSFLHSHAQQNAISSYECSIEAREVVISKAFYGVNYRPRCLKWATVRRVCL